MRTRSKRTMATPLLDPFADLAEKLRALPGVGLRQARRMAEYLGRMPQEEVEALVRSLRALSESLARCPCCHRMFVPSQNQSGETQYCQLCGDNTRDETTLMVVAKDIDLLTIERSGTYKGRYFVLGRLLTFSGATERGLLPLAALSERVAALPPGGEVIIALGVTADAEVTARAVSEEITPKLPPGVRLTMLGRGLSTGTEIEYADPNTLSYALRFRQPLVSPTTEEIQPAAGSEE